MRLRSKPIFSLYMQKWSASMRDLTGRYRERRIVCARAEIARALWNMDYTSVRIAKLLQRNHSTVLYYLGFGKKKLTNYKGITVMAKRKLTDAQRAELVRLHQQKPALATKKAKELGVSPNYGCILAGRLKSPTPAMRRNGWRKQSAAETRKWERARALGPINTGAGR